MSAYPKPLTGLTRPIPDEALAVVAILRRDVPRPKLPTMSRYREKLDWFDRGRPCCAAGLAPKALYGFPGGAHSFGYENEGITDAQVESFTWWFDDQVNAQDVVDAIWPMDFLNQALLCISQFVIIIWT